MSSNDTPQPTLPRALPQILALWWRIIVLPLSFLSIYSIYQLLQDTSNAWYDPVAWGVAAFLLCSFFVVVIKKGLQQPEEASLRKWVKGVTWGFVAVYSGYLLYFLYFARTSPSVTTLAGTSERGARDGESHEATFYMPYDVYVHGELVYVLEHWGAALRTINTKDNNKVGTVAVKTCPNQPGEIKLGFLTGMAADNSGNLYISDAKYQRILMFDAMAGCFSLVAGSTSGEAGYVDGSLADARFDFPESIVADSHNNLFVVDNGNHCIRRIAMNKNLVDTFAGKCGKPDYNDGKGQAARFNDPGSMDIDTKTGIIYLADAGNHRIRQITLAGDPDNPTGDVVTLAGGKAGFHDGTSEAQFNYPSDVVWDSGRNVLYVADWRNHRIRRMLPRPTPPWKVESIAGGDSAAFKNGPGKFARFYTPAGIALTSSGSYLLVADSEDDRVRKIILPPKE